MMKPEATSEATVPAKRPKGILFVVVKVAISVVVLSALVWRFKHDIPSLSTVHPWPAIAAAALLLLQPVLIGARWRLILGRYGTTVSSLKALVAVTWVSVFANQFLPAGVGGDAVRVVYACRLGNRLGAATASVVIDRIMALVALVFLIIINASHLPAVIDRRLIDGLAALCGAGLIFLIAVYSYVSRSHHLHSPAWMRRILELIFYVLRAFAAPLESVSAIALSVVVHLISFLAFYLIVRSIDLDVAVPPFIAVSALLTFIQMVPISIGGWGIREIAAVSLLGTIGVDAGPALLASLLLGICYAAASIPGAIIWPFIKGDRIVGVRT